MQSYSAIIIYLSLSLTMVINAGLCDHCERLLGSHFQSPEIIQCIFLNLVRIVNVS